MVHEVGVVCPLMEAEWSTGHPCLGEYIVACWFSCCLQEERRNFFIRFIDHLRESFRPFQPMMILISVVVRVTEFILICHLNYIHIKIMS